jgi:hypothetical protein
VGPVHVGGQRFSRAVDIRRRGYVPVTRLNPAQRLRAGATGETKKAAQRLFGNQALTVKPVTPVGPPRRDPRINVQTDPSARQR